MSFSEAVGICLTKKYADFSGRAGRAEYWWFALFNALALGLLYLLAVAAVVNDVEAIAWVALILMLVAWLGLFVPGLAVAVRRLHDLNTGMPGWWLLASFIPFGGLVLFVMFLMGSGPDNKYGPSAGPVLGYAPAPPVGVAAAAPVAGWLADPNDPTQLRYWDGNTWTDHIHRA